MSPCTSGPGRWRVRQRHQNHSAFNGYKPTYSDYSEVVCIDCWNRWRTKAAYVDSLPDITNAEEGV